MNIIISNSSMEPLYEQIIRQIKEGIIEKKLLEGAMLPSVRGLAKDLKISALTVKKAYDQLEEQGFIVTVHGKGSFVAENNQSLAEESQKREVEELLEQAMYNAKRCKMACEEFEALFKLLLEEW